MNDLKRIGFMQGRLSPMVDGRIQAFPWQYWQDEFSAAKTHGFRAMEWTLDQDRLYENPLLTTEGRRRIRQLCVQNDLLIPSLTGDCFMQAPFWKQDGQQGDALRQDFLAVCDACAELEIALIVVPLVDNGRLDNFDQENILVTFLLQQADRFTALGLRILFESDFAPQALARFIGRLPENVFGVNYDIGNSAALGFDPIDEFAAYGPRIVNVHVKDRILGGTTVPLGSGNADFDLVFSELAKIDYRGNFILQTARAGDDQHAQVLSRYRNQVLDWMHRFSAPTRCG